MVFFTNPSKEYARQIGSSPQGNHRLLRQAIGWKNYFSNLPNLKNQPTVESYPSSYFQASFNNFTTFTSPPPIGPSPSTINQHNSSTSTSTTSTTRRAPLNQPSMPGTCATCGVMPGVITPPSPPKAPMLKGSSWPKLAAAASMPGRPEQIARGGEDPVELWFSGLASIWGGGVSLKMVGFPNKPWVFSTKNDHFGVWLGGYHHWRKHPYYG